jgi:hypothetical protein
VDPPKFIISRFLPAGLHLLAGSPKIDKSWLALWLYHQVSRGAAVWEFDTLQCGEEVNRIKSVADRHEIAVLLVHHLRKMPDSDPFNMVSGSTGIIGAVDSIFVLEKDCRTDNKAKLHPGSPQNPQISWGGGHRPRY